MKTSSLFFLLFLFIFAQAHASYLGNICSPAVLQTGLFSKHNYLLNLTSGYITDMTWDKKIKPSSLPNTISLEKVDEFEINSNWATFSLVLLRRLEMYTYLGVSKEKMDWTNKPSFTDTSEVKTQNHFSYVLGAKLNLLYLGNFGLGVSGQYFSLPSSNKLVQRIRDLNLPFEIGSQYLKVDEWQIASGLTCFLGPFTPYAGIKYLDMQVRVKSTTDLPVLHFENQNNWGVFVGCSLIFSCNFYLNVEGRFIDETAVGASAIAAF